MECFLVFSSRSQRVAPVDLFVVFGRYFLRFISLIFRNDCLFSLLVAAAHICKYHVITLKRYKYQIEPNKAYT